MQLLTAIMKIFSRRGIYVGIRAVNKYSSLVPKSIRKSNPGYVVLSNFTVMEGVLQQVNSNAKCFTAEYMVFFVVV